MQDIDFHRLEVKGHNLQIQTLIENVKKNNIACSYLFLGPSGIGKRLVAINFAKLLNCLNRKEGNAPCNQCISCKKINNLNHPDVYLICPDASAAIKIDNIRQITKRANFRPYEGKYKIFIIDSAETMTEEAANAFLKTLEEPQKSTIFILIASQQERLLTTIVSRCRKIRFNLLKLNEIKDLLMRDYGLSEKKAYFISCLSEGKVSLALRFKDKEMLSEKNRIIDDFIYKKVTFKDREDAKYKLNLFLSYLRDLLLLKIYKKSFLINLDREEDLIRNRNRYTLAQLENSISFIVEAMGYLERNINIRLLTNLVKIKL
jgi:DNA polymerase-3 subunit delta'